MLHPHPSHEQHAEDKVEQPLVRDGEDDEDGAEGQEEHDQAVEVVVVRAEAMHERH